MFAARWGRRWRQAVQGIELARWLFFRHDRATPPPLRPPWAREPAFTDRCTRCDRCIAACPQRILVRTSDGLPQVDFSRTHCTFCSACRDACPEPLFERGEIESPWRQHAHIDGRCVATRGVPCQACRDPCPTRAIRFAFAGSPVPLPRVLAVDCTGCGACVSACPQGAIRVELSCDHLTA